MNTVGQAQKVYSALEKCFDGDLLLFHAQFPAFRRQEIEEECIRKFGKDKSLRPQRAILVATQVVEQSLDVDFDSMMTAVAPIDLVLQRMGRIFRHEDTLRPTQMHSPRQFVMVPKGEDFGADAYVYPEVLLRQTVRVLSNHSQVRIPEDLATMVAEGYDQESVPSEGRLQWMEHIIGEQVKAEQSKMFLIGAPSKSYSATDDSVLLYEDEGDNYNYEKGEYSTISLKWNDRSRTLSIGERKGSFAGMLSDRTFVVTLPDGSSKTVEYNGKAIKVKF
jgi:CRISPR-associated endonuclease/helicase Cas3